MKVSSAGGHVSKSDCFSKPKWDLANSIKLIKIICSSRVSFCPQKYKCDSKVFHEGNDKINLGEPAENMPLLLKSTHWKARGSAYTGEDGAHARSISARCCILSSCQRFNIVAPKFPHAATFSPCVHIWFFGGDSSGPADVIGRHGFKFCVFWDSVLRFLWYCSAVQLAVFVILPVTFLVSTFNIYDRKNWTQLKFRPKTILFY